MPNTPTLVTTPNSASALASAQTPFRFEDFLLPSTPQNPGATAQSGNFFGNPNSLSGAPSFADFLQPNQLAPIYTGGSSSTASDTEALLAPLAPFLLGHSSLPSTSANITHPALLAQASSPSKMVVPQISLNPLSLGDLLAPAPLNLSRKPSLRRQVVAREVDPFLGYVQTPKKLDPVEKTQQILDQLIIFLTNSTSHERTQKFIELFEAAKKRLNQLLLQGEQQHIHDLMIPHILEITQDFVENEFKCMEQTHDDFVNEVNTLNKHDLAVSRSVGVEINELGAALKKLKLKIKDFVQNNEISLESDEDLGEILASIQSAQNKIKAISVKPTTLVQAEMLHEHFDKAIGILNKHFVVDTKAHREVGGALINLKRTYEQIKAAIAANNENTFHRNVQNYHHYLGQILNTQLTLRENLWNVNQSILSNLQKPLLDAGIHLKYLELYPKVLHNFNWVVSLLDKAEEDANQTPRFRLGIEQTTFQAETPRSDLTDFSTPRSLIAPLTFGQPTPLGVFNALSAKITRNIQAFQKYSAQISDLCARIPQGRKFEQIAEMVSIFEDFRTTFNENYAVLQNPFATVIDLRVANDNLLALIGAPNFEAFLNVCEAQFPTAEEIAAAAPKVRNPSPFLRRLCLR